MHIAIIWQYDDGVRNALQPLLALGTDTAITPVKGHHVRLHQMVPDFPKGANIDAFLILGTILTVAADALQKAERAADMRVIFIFHQTSRETVNGIMRALRMLTPDVLDSLAQQAGKTLTVGNVVLLSCESGTDKAVPNPVPPELVPWVDQAHNMRVAALQAFTVGQALPLVITFSTGNAVTGAITLNPFAAEFRALRGHFNPDGTWDYDLDANGQPDHTQTPSTGNLYADTGQPGGESTQAIPAGVQVNLMPFTLP